MTARLTSTIRTARKIWASATGTAVATVSFTGVFGNYLRESCNGAAGGYGGPEAVLTWTAPSGGTYQFDTSGSTFDTVLAAYKGNPLTGCTELGLQR